MNKKTELTTVIQKIDEVRIMLERHNDNPQLIPHIESALVMEKLQFAYDIYFKITNRNILNTDIELGESTLESNVKSEEEIITRQVENNTVDINEEPEKLEISKKEESVVETQIKSDGEEFKPIEPDDKNKDIPDSELLVLSKGNEIELFPDEVEKAEIDEIEEGVTVNQNESVPKGTKDELEIKSYPEETIDLFSKTFEPELKTVADEISEKVQEESVADKFQKNKISDLKEAIGINEKFFFINELFDGVMKDYNEAIKTLNSFSTQDSCLDYLEQQKEERAWKEESEALVQLKEILSRKYNF